MIIAIYKCNSKANPEQIRVHMYNNGDIHLEAVGNFYAHEIDGFFDNLLQVEEYLKFRDDIFGYTRLI